MKKIFLLFAAACAFVACDPVHEDIGNAGHITIDELRAKTSITVDKAPSGLNGNQIFCKTSAPVNAKWTIGGKDFVGNYAWKKMKLGKYKVYLNALCADGTLLKDSVELECQEITNALEKFVLWEGEFTANGWDAAPLRFSDSEGQNFPTLSDDFYFGLKTLIIDVKDASAGCTARVMNGWWSSTYADNIPLSAGMKWEVTITEQMAKECAKGGEGRDLNLLITNGNATFTSVYYEE